MVILTVKQSIVTAIATMLHLRLSEIGRLSGQLDESERLLLAYVHHELTVAAVLLVRAMVVVLYVLLVGQIPPSDDHHLVVLAVGDRLEVAEAALLVVSVVDDAKEVAGD